MSTLDDDNCALVVNCDAKKSAVQEKRKKEYEARKARLARAEALKAARHVLCVDGNPDMPIVVDQDGFEGAAIMPL